MCSRVVALLWNNEAVTAVEEAAADTQDDDHTAKRATGGNHEHDQYLVAHGLGRVRRRPPARLGPDPPARPDQQKCAPGCFWLPQSGAESRC